MAQTVENTIQQLIGSYVFNLAVAQTNLQNLAEQLEQLQKEHADLKAQLAAASNAKVVPFQAKTTGLSSGQLRDNDKGDPSN